MEFRPSGDNLTLTGGMMSDKQRRRFSGEEKVSAVKRHLVDNIPVSDLCDELGLLPTQFYQWQKQLFEQGVAAFDKSGGNSNVSAGRIAALEGVLARRNAALAELVEQVLLGPENGGSNRLRNGTQRKASGGPGGRQ